MATKTYRSIYISEERDRALRQASEAEGISISKLAGKAFDFYLGMDSRIRQRLELGEEKHIGCTSKAHC